jgi:hypothetical protein
MAEVGKRMDGQQLLASIAGSVEQEILLRNAYLVTENRIHDCDSKCCPALQRTMECGPHARARSHRHARKSHPMPGPVGRAAKVLPPRGCMNALLVCTGEVPHGGAVLC